MKRICGIIYGPEPHYIDHVAPMCALLNIALYVTEKEIQKLCEKYYPNLSIYLVPHLSFAKVVTENAEVILSNLPTQLLAPLFYFEEYKAKKKLLTIWLPHGNSDKKGLAALTEEKIGLIYGDSMERSLAEEKVLSHFYRALRIGNYRRYFFEENLEFYRKTLFPKLYFPKKQTTLLFAPSWENDVLSKKVPKIIGDLPDNLNLIIKPHPNAVKRGHFEAVRELSSEKPNVLYLETLCPIYPLLAESHIYIGDHSSIAYDFLSFNRPLFFLCESSSPIHQVGIITNVERLFKDLERRDIYEKQRQSLYRDAFDPDVNFDEIPTTLEDAITSYFDEEIHLL